MFSDVNTIITEDNKVCNLNEIKDRYLGPILHGKREPLGDRGILPTRVEDTVVLQANFEHGRSTLSSRVKR